MRLAERLPVEVGEKTTVAPQLEPAKRVAPQVVFEIKKSPALAPDMVMLMAIVDELSFVTVTCCELPDAPTGTPDQEREVGVTLTPETEMQPVSSRATAARSRPARKALGAFCALADAQLTAIIEGCRQQDLSNRQIRAEPLLQPVWARRAKPDLEDRGKLPTFSDSVRLD